MAIYRRNGPMPMSELRGFIAGNVFSLGMDELYRGGTYVPSQGYSGGTPGEYLIIVDENANSGGGVLTNREQFSLFINTNTSQYRDTGVTYTTAPVANADGDDTITITATQDFPILSIEVTADVTAATTANSTITYPDLRRAALDSTATAFALYEANPPNQVNSLTFSGGFNNFPRNTSIRNGDVITLTGISNLRNISLVFNADINRQRYQLTLGSDVINIFIANGLNSLTEVRDDILNTLSNNTTVTDNWELLAENRIVNILDTERLTGVTGGVPDGQSGGLLLLGDQTSNPQLTDLSVVWFAGGEGHDGTGDAIRIGGSNPGTYNSELDITTYDGGFQFDSTNQGTNIPITIIPDYSGRVPRVNRSVPVITFTSRDMLNHAISLSSTGTSRVFPTYVEEVLHPIADGSNTSAEIRIDFGVGVNPQTEDIILGLTDANGIAEGMVEAINNHGELFADLSAPRNVRIEDSRQRFLDRPLVTVTTPGSSNLQDSDFLRFTQTTGVPPTTEFSFTRRYDNLDARPLTDGDWNFQNGSGTTASNIQPTAWPTTGNAFVAFREQPGGLLTAGGAFATFLGLSSFSGSQSFTDLTLTLTAGTNTVTYPVTAINVIGQDLIATVTASAFRTLIDVPPLNGQGTTFNWVRGTFGEINTSVPESGEISLSDLYGVNDGENT